jgi:hypothetical protein
MTVIFAPITGSLLPSVTKPVTEFCAKLMQQKKKDKKKCTHSLNFIDLWSQSTINFTINKRSAFNYQ